MQIIEIRYLLLALVGIISAVWVLSAWLEKRRQLDSRRQTYHDLYERLPTGILIIDQSQACVYANPAGRHLLQLGKVPGPLPAAEPWAMELLSVRLSGAQTNGEEDAATVSRIMAMPTGKILHWRVVAMPEAHRLIVLEDITRLTQLKRTSGHLLNELSHELRTPVSVILTHLHILGQPEFAEAIKSESLNMAQKEAQHMQRLVHDMLELGRLEARETLDKQPLDLNIVVSQVMDEIAERASHKNIGIGVEIETNLPLIEGNEMWLKRVYLNLIDNAIKHGRNGDQVSIEIVSANGGVRSSICDTGPGIPAKHLPLITERFHQVNRHDQLGSGLGLALATTILQRHDSFLDIESRHEDEYGESGTCVRFVLPMRLSQGQDDA